MSTRTLRLSHDIDGTATDYDSVPVLRDPTLAYGVERTDTHAVIVAANEPFEVDSTGRYHYDVTGITAGVEYRAYVEVVYLGETKRTPVTWVAETDDAATPYYFTRDGARETLGRVNFDTGANLDNESSDEPDEATLQSLFDKVDNQIDGIAYTLGLTADATATAPHFVATDAAVYALIEPWAEELAAVRIYRSRGIVGRDENGTSVEGQLTTKYKEAVAAITGLLAQYRQSQLVAAGQDGMNLIHPGCDCGVLDAARPLCN